MDEKPNKKSEYDWLEQHDKHMKNWRAWGLGLAGVRQLVLVYFTL